MEDQQHFNEDTMYTGKSSRNPYMPMLGGVLGGIVFIAFGIWLYNDLAAWELSNEEMSMHSILWRIYDLGGKLAVAGVFVGMGAIVMGVSIAKTIRLKKLKSQVD